MSFASSRAARALWQLTSAIPSASTTLAMRLSAWKPVVVRTALFPVLLVSVSMLGYIASAVPYCNHAKSLQRNAADHDTDVVVTWAHMIQAAPLNTLPTDNELDVPCLRLDMQGRLEYPAAVWGSVSRGARMPGTWLFYVDDYRFGALERAPLQLVATDCKHACELNVSVFESTPYPYALWSIWRKRSIARQWQDAGIGIWVDLCVPQRFASISLLGVPRGWQSYATRGFAGREDELGQEYDQALAHGGPGAKLLVYGGGRRIKEACMALPNAIHIEQFAESRHGKR